MSDRRRVPYDRETLLSALNRAAGSWCDDWDPLVEQGSESNRDSVRGTERAVDEQCDRTGDDE